MLWPARTLSRLGLDLKITALWLQNGRGSRCNSTSALAETNSWARLVSSSRTASSSQAGNCFYLRRGIAGTTAYQSCSYGHMTCAVRTSSGIPPNAAIHLKFFQHDLQPAAYLPSILVHGQLYW